jgi:hypothetical protein
MMITARDRKIGNQEQEPGENGASLLHTLTAIHDSITRRILSSAQTAIFKNLRARRESRISGLP